jgi:hypothetical protein
MIKHHMSLNESNYHTNKLDQWLSYYPYTNSVKSMLIVLILITSTIPIVVIKVI